MNHLDWDARYSAEPALWGAEPNQFVRARLAALDPGVAVDLACGNGRNAVWLAGRGWRVTGVDNSSVALDQARARADGLDVPVEWVQADVLDWRSPRPVDLALVAYLHLPLPDLIEVLAAAAAGLRPGGRLLYVGHARSNLARGVGGPSDPEVLAEIADLAAVVDGLQVVELAHVTRETDTGRAIDILLEAMPWENGTPDPPPAEQHPGVTRGAARS